MKLQGDEYEVIILGSGLGGLITGTWLAREKHRVLLLKEKKYRPFYLKDGYRFVPFSNFSEKRLKVTLLNKISMALNLSLLTADREMVHGSKTKLKKSMEKVAFQVILPKARVDLFCRRSAFQMEWKREFPKEFAPIENFYKEMEQYQNLLMKIKAEEGPWSVFPIQPRSLIKKWSPFKSLPKGRLDERLASFSREFREFMRLQLVSLGNFYSDQFPLSLAEYLLYNDEREEWVSEVDLESLKESISEKFFELGGRIEEVEGIEKIDIGWRRGVTLTSKGDQGVFQSKYLIFNTPLHRLTNLLGRRKKRISKWEEKIRRRYILTPFFLGVREKLVPVGMRDLLVSIFDLDKPFEGGNVLLIALSQKRDETDAPEEKRAVVVEGLMPIDEWDESSMEEYQKKVLDHLRYLFPFLDENIEFMDKTWSEEQSACWSYPHFIYETTSDFKWREGVVPHRISKNLYFIGKENFPYLGLEGEVLSGLTVAQQILEKY